MQYLVILAAEAPWRGPLMELLTWIITRPSPEVLSEAWQWLVLIVLIGGWWLAWHRHSAYEREKRELSRLAEKSGILDWHEVSTQRAGEGPLATQLHQAVDQWKAARKHLPADVKGSPIDITQLLAWSQLEEQIINQRVMRLLPGVLVGLGILGTFVGLTAAIAGMNFAAISTQDVNKMLSGMTLAFSSSIAGIFSSLLFQVASNHRLRQTEKSHRVLCQRLQEEFPYLAPEGMEGFALAEQRAQGALVAERIQAMQEALASKLGEAERQHVATQLLESERQQAQHEALLATLREELTQVAADNAADIRGLASNIDQALAQRVESSFTNFLTVFQEQQQEGWQALTSTIRDQVHDLTAKEFAALREVLNDIIQLHEREAEARERGITSLEKATASGEVMLLALEDSSRHLQEYSTSLQALQQSLLAEVKGQGAAQEAQLQLLAELKSSLNAFHEAQVETAAELRRSLQDTLSAAVSFISQTIERQQQELQAAMAQFNEREQALERSFEAATGRLEEAIEAAVSGIAAGGASMASELRAAIQDELLSTMTKVMESLEEGRETLARHLDEIRDQTENLTDSLKGLLKDVRSQQSDYSAELRTLQASIIESASTLKKMTQDLANASAGLATQATAQLNSFRDETDRLLTIAAKHLSGTVKEMSGTLTEMRDATEPLPMAMIVFQSELKAVVGELVRLRKSFPQPDSNGKEPSI